MKTGTIILAAAALLSSAALSAQSGDEARLLRFPATNGREVVFSYAGDLWEVPISGGKATRLTSDPGFEAFARFSPDGRTIAFSAEYDGNREVYTMPDGGGIPVRLTYTATNARDNMGDRMGPNNIVMGWTPDGKNITFRNRIGDGFLGNLWNAPAGGGMPQELPLPTGGFCCWSPDGNSLAYNRVMREFRTWKYYRGGQADDIRIYDTKAGKITKITDDRAQDIFPMWIGDEIYFASDRDMTMNLFVYDTRTGATTKVTDYTDYDVKFPSCGGGKIVYEHAGWIYVLDPATKKSTKLDVTLSSDFVQGRTELRDVSSSWNSISLPASGKRIAVTARGEVFDVPVGQGVTKNITRTPGSNDREASWSPDGKWIAYIGDSTGETEIYLYSPEDGKTRQLTSKNDTYIYSLQWAPDSKSLYYSDRENRLVRVSVPDGAKKTLLQNPQSPFSSLSVSPDSKWLAYTKPAGNEMSVVYVMSADGGKEIPVTEKWYSSGAPTFSADGKYLIFTSARDFNPIYSQVEWNYAYTNMNGIYMALLASDTPSPMLPSDVALEDKKSAEGAAARGGDKSAPEAAPAVRIDPEGLTDRIIRIPVSNGNTRSFYSDGKKLWFSSRGATRVFDFATGKEDKVADATLLYEPGGKKAAFMKGKSLYVCDFPSSHVSLDEPLALDGMKAVVDYDKEWPLLFDEVWRAFRDGYYLKNMNGRDWNAMKAKYEVFLPYVHTRLDLNYVIGEMIAELGTGHAYINPGELPEVKRIETGLLGARLSRTSDGGFRIDEILPGASYRPELYSPLCQPGLGVEEGDVITAVDGVPTSSVENIYELLLGKAGVLTELTIGGKKVVVKPIADEYPLYHYKWVTDNIRKVEEKSGGKVGYIYIPDMGPEGLNEFARYYYPQLDKEALIIDDRVNGGGNVSPMIIERLQREAYNMTMRRGSTMTSTVPEGTHTGPKILLVNEYSSSDGDLFPWRFQAEKLGTIIGKRTWGGIVGISGSLPYMDGTDVRVPFFTNYDARTGKWIVENHGVDPDIEVDNDPLKEFAGEDQQLDRAVEEAIRQIKDRKALPGVPAPRTFKDLGGLSQPDDSQFLK